MLQSVWRSHVSVGGWTFSAAPQRRHTTSLLGPGMSAHPLVAGELCSILSNGRSKEGFPFFVF